LNEKDMLSVGTAALKTPTSEQTIMPTFATDVTTGMSNGLLFLFSICYQIAAIWKYGFVDLSLMFVLLLQGQLLVVDMETCLYVAVLK